MKDKNNGILIPVGDQKALLDALNTIVDNKELSEKFSNEAVKVREDYSIEIIGKMWLGLCDNRGEIVK